MTSYRQSMNQTLDLMYLMREVKILERELTDKELKRREEIAKDLPDDEFKDRYGKDWMSVKMATTATKMAKAEELEMDDEDEEDDEDEKRERLKEKAGVSLAKKASNIWYSCRYSETGLQSWCRLYVANKIARWNINPQAMSGGMLLGEQFHFKIEGHLGWCR